MKSKTDLLSNRVLQLTILLFAIIVVFSFLSSNFLSLSNLLGITQFGAPLALLALGQAVVILLGKSGIDISVGANLSLSGVVFGIMITNQVPIVLAIIIICVFGGILGSINGFIISKLGFAPMIATLGTSYVFASLSLYLTQGKPISGMPPQLAWIGHGDILRIPNQILFVVVPVFIVVYIVMNKSTLGRKLYLVGSNNEAAHLAGLEPTKLRFFSYVFSGVMAGLASVVMVSWLMTAKADAGVGLEMQAITASILGGFSITGGTGNTAGVVLAVLIVTFLTSGLQMINVSSIVRLGILGLMLIGVLVFDNFINKKSSN